METVLLIDIGSTYTKAAIIDLERLSIVRRSQSLTTINNNILIGLKKVLLKLEGWEKAHYKLACSSAAGGLKIVAIGLVPELTAEAVRRAALGAGSRILKTYCYELTAEDIMEISQLKADIILLAGGTDGGNKEVILQNAHKLAKEEIKCPIIIAGNRAVEANVKNILTKAGKVSYITENVMPELEELNIEPARNKIREIFLNTIVQAKGLNKVKEFIDGIIMPTPAAVLKSASLLAQGYKDNPGLGELIVVDIGGATTDVHSVAQGEPVDTKIKWRGLEEPFIKRTVEGDIGMRFNAPSLMKIIGEESIKNQVYKLTGNHINSSELKNYLSKIHKQVNYLPISKNEKIIEKILAKNATQIASARHVGNVKKFYTPMGSSYIQEGKDLRNIKTVIGTGGIIAYSEKPELIMQGVLYKNQNSTQLLSPINPNILLDRKYIMALAGLLANVEPLKSLQLLKKYVN